MAANEEGDVTEVSEEMQTEEVIEEEDFTEQEPFPEEEWLIELGTVLGVPVDILQAIATSSDFCIVAQQIYHYYSAKTNEIEEYSSTLQEFTENFEEVQKQLGNYMEEKELLETQLNVEKINNTELERQRNQQEEELKKLHNQLSDTSEQFSELQDVCETLRNESHDRQLTIEELEEELAKAKNEIEEMRPPPDVPGADREELLRLLDRRQHEIGRLTEDWKSLSEKLEMTLSAKQELQSKLDDFVTQEASLNLREQLLSQEKQLLQQQNQWLTNELETKSKELLEVKKEKTATLSDKEMSLTKKDQELSHLQSSVASKTTLIQELQGRLDSTHQRLVEIREEQANVEDQLRRELAAQSKLAFLYQSDSEDKEKIVKELVSKLEILQTSFDELSQEKEETVKKAVDLEEKLTGLQSESSQRISSLENELKNANDLLATARHHGALPFTEGEVMSLSPSASATSARLLSGMTLTQIYTRYVESCDELRQEKDENTRLNNYLTQIMQELDEKTPALQKLRKDHDVLLHRCQSQQDKLENVLEECETLRLESEEALKVTRSVERENKRLKVLSGDLGRQVKTLLKECEEARGGVASTSHNWSHDISSDDITTSSQVISDHLVIFRNIEELQEQNQKLLAVVRELSESSEQRENEEESQATLELRQRLDDAIKELDSLKESRERQKEMVEAIVKQRDMYRILLAQSTPLPESDGSLLNVSQDSAHSIGSTPQKMAATDQALQELKEQFEAYRREKAANDNVLKEQINQYRDEAASTRLDNAKLVSKLEYSNERYQMLESNYKELKSEMTALRNKEKVMTNSLTKHQGTVSTLTQELLSSREKYSHLEVTQRTLKSERDLLVESERRARQQYESLLREQKAQNVLLTNLQTIQNNLERSDFETKTRLTSQAQALEKELVIVKEKLHTEEERREKIKDAYETQIQDVSKKLLLTQTHETELYQTLTTSEERVKNLDSALSTTKEALQETQRQLEEANNRLRAMEEDAGAEFRSKVRLLERKLSDATNKISSLQEQLQSAQSHTTQYKEMSEANEKALQELNKTSEEFTTKLNTELERLQSREKDLLAELESLKEEKDDIESRLTSELKETQEKLVATQDTTKELHSQVEEAKENLIQAQTDHLVAREDAKRCSNLSHEYQDLYQRELVQHGHTMEELATLRDKEQERQEELASTKEEITKLKEEQDNFMATYKEREESLLKEKTTLEERCEYLNTQNELLHSESEKLSARIITLTQPSGGSIVPLQADRTESIEEGGGLATPSNSDHLWEIIRYVKREKEIAVTKREMVESECTQLKQTVDRLQRQLADSNSQLQELSEATKAHQETSAQYEEIMSKVQTLNILSDSNTLLREEKDSLKKQLVTLEEKALDNEKLIQSLQETQHSLTAQKDSLLAEKVALKNEVERWNARTNQLIEQYNKIDPEEYKELVEEKDARNAELASLKTEFESIKQEKEDEKKKMTEEIGRLQELADTCGKKEEELGEELSKLQAELKTVKDELGEKNKMITKLRELGRRYRSLSEEYKKKNDELEAQKTDLESQLEEAKRTLPESTDQQPAVNESQEQIDQLKSELETTKVSLADKEERLAKVVKTAKLLKAKHDALKIEKENVETSLKEAKASQDELAQRVTELESQDSTAELQTLQQQHDVETKKLEEKIAKLEQELRSKTTRRRVVQPTVVASVESPSTTVTTQPAPTAAVRPTVTVTTTPTASIRPMPLQTTTAPTAHVTPTQVTTSIPVTTEATPTQSTIGSAAVFVRSSPPLHVTQARPQATPTSSVADVSNAPPTRLIERPVKRTREAIESSSVGEQPPATKRPKQQIVSEAEPSTTTDHASSAPLVDNAVPTESMAAPDTQSDQEMQPPDEQATPPNDVDVTENVAMVTEEPHRRLESTELPSSEIVADTTSDEATEPLEETGLTSSQVIPDEEEVTMDTEPEATVITEPVEDVAPSEPLPESLEREQNEEEQEEVVEVVVSVDEYVDEERGEEEVEEEEVEEEDNEEVVDEEEGEGEGEGEDEEEDNEKREEPFVIQVDVSDEEMSEDEKQESHSLSSQELIVLDETTPPVTEEHSVDLPDDEITVEIPAPSSSTSLPRPPVIMTTNQSDPARRLRLTFGERAHTPGIEMGVTTGDDHQVPCTPVLADDKQLGKTPAQSVPGELTAPTSTLITEQSHSVPHSSGNIVGTSSQAGVISSLGETQLEELSSTTGSAHPLSSEVIHEPSPPEPTDQDDQVQMLMEVGQDGDIGDDVIDEIIAQDSSSDDDIEEGELAEVPPVIVVTDETGSQPSSSRNVPTTQEVEPSTQGRSKIIQPIIWDQPSTSGSSGTQRPVKVAKTSASIRRPRGRGGRRGRGALGRK